MNKFDWKFWLIVIICYVVSIVTTLAIIKMDQKDKLEDDYDYCYECGGYGNDYSFDDDGDLVCNCDDCPFNPVRHDYFRWKY